MHLRLFRRVARGKARLPRRVDHAGEVHATGSNTDFVGGQNIIDQTFANVHLISCGSTEMKRLVNSTIEADTEQLIDVFESADVRTTRSTTISGTCPRPLELPACCPQTEIVVKTWCRNPSQRVWIICWGVGLRHDLWRCNRQACPDNIYPKDKPANLTDIVRWLDTTGMVVDCLNAMRDELLTEVITNNVSDFSHSEEDMLVMLKTQQLSKQAENGRCPCSSVFVSGVAP